MFIVTMQRKKEDRPRVICNDAGLTYWGLRQTDSRHIVRYASKERAEKIARNLGGTVEREA